MNSHADCISANSKKHFTLIAQFTLHINPGLFGFWRQSLDRQQSLFAVTNICGDAKTLSLRDINLFANAQWVDLLRDEEVNPEDEELILQPYQTVDFQSAALTAILNWYYLPHRPVTAGTTGLAALTRFQLGNHAPSDCLNKSHRQA